jgi:hypothetical protein
VQFTRDTLPIYCAVSLSSLNPCLHVLRARLGRVARVAHRIPDIPHTQHKAFYPHQPVQGSLKRWGLSHCPLPRQLWRGRGSVPEYKTHQHKGCAFLHLLKIC